MGAVKKIESFWGNQLLNGTESLGNTGESILDKVSDLLNDYCRTSKEVNEVAEATFLAPSTIRRLMDRTPTEEGNDYDARGDTNSRVLLYFGAKITWSQERSIKPRYLPGAKK